MVGYAPVFHGWHVGGDWGVEGPDGSVLLPQTVPLSGAYLEERGAYLLDNGRVLVLWLGRMLDRQWGMEVGGPASLLHMQRAVLTLIHRTEEW